MAGAKKAGPRASTTAYRNRKELWTYWMTRDSDPDTGAVDAKVRVWLSQPTRYEVKRGCFWLARGAMADHFADWTTDECVGACGVYPDDSRQSIRCGPLEDARDPTKEPATS